MAILSPCRCLREEASGPSRSSIRSTVAPPRADRRPNGRRTLRRHRRRLLPDHAREHHGHESGRRRQGVVRGLGRHGHERLVHVYRDGRVLEPRSSARGPRTTRASRPSTRRPPARPTSRTTSTRSPPTGSAPTSTTWTPTPERRRARSVSSATMTLSSGTRATTSSREIPAWSPAPPHASRTTRYSPSGRTSTRAAACSGPARTPALGRRSGTSSSSRRTRRATRMTRARTDVSRYKTTSCSTTLGRFSTTTTPAPLQTASSTTL